MTQTLYQPFRNLHFNAQTCFLSGEKLTEADKPISVFPVWLMEKFKLEDKAFKLLDESIVAYRDLQLPCSAATAMAFARLDEEIREGFTSGYEKVKNLEPLKLFQWIGKIVYGIIYNEISAGIRQQRAGGEPFNLSQSLAHKFGNLHIMLQSLIRPMEFESNTPFSIQIFRVENNQEVFNYRDEINTLTFSLGMNDFGIIACLQDNGVNQKYHQEVLDNIRNEKLHPIQFEELCARFYYSGYLFNRLPEYTVLPTNDMVYIESMPLRGMSSKPLFDVWQGKPYGQVLENLWKPWGFSLFEIIKDPEKPMSFLLDENGQFIPAENLKITS